MGCKEFLQLMNCCIPTHETFGDDPQNVISFVQKKVLLILRPAHEVCPAPAVIEDCTSGPETVFIKAAVEGDL